MDTNIGHFIGHTDKNVKDNDVLDIKDIRKRSLQVFENKEYFNLAILKTEKLASALYLVSNLISDIEPLKWTMRKVGTDIISDISLMGVAPSNKGHKVSLEKITAKIFEITSLLQVAWMGGLISNMNFEILRSEYFKLGNFLKDKFYSTTPDRLLVSKNFFLSDELREVEETAKKNSAEKNNEGENSSFLNSNNDIDSELKARHRPPASSVKDISHKGQEREEFLSKRHHDKGQIVMFARKGVTDNSMSDKNKEKRHSKILSLLSSQLSYSVPEILKIIGMGETLSEKTIQRDLIQLVSKGSLKKTGERRWSRYQLL